MGFDDSFGDAANVFAEGFVGSTVVTHLTRLPIYMIVVWSQILLDFICRDLTYFKKGDLRVRPSTTESCKYLDFQDDTLHEGASRRGASLGKSCCGWMLPLGRFEEVCFDT